MHGIGFKMLMLRLPCAESCPSPLFGTELPTEDIGASVGDRG
jgi:hypothetical protein